VRDKRLQEAKEAAIKKDYAELASQRKYSRVYICDTLSLKYHLKANTIERIVWGEYDTNRQRQAQRAGLQAAA
jgi:hypothetical protein